MPPKPRKPRRKKVAASSRGLLATEVKAAPPAAMEQLAQEVETDGGAALAPYRDPLSGNWLLLAALPVDQVEPTPYQRKLSDAHLKRLVEVLEKVSIYLDPIIATREGAKSYWTPNGNHRLAAMKKLGAKAILALVVPEREIAFKILALNTEKSHNLKEKSLEVIGMARVLAAAADSHKETELALEFEEPVLLTLGVCYEQNPRFAGAAYRPALRRAEEFIDKPLAQALAARDERGAELLALDEKVTQIIAALKERGITSPYLRSFVTARINPVRFAKEVTMTPEELLKKMRAAADKFNVAKVRPDQVAAVAAFGVSEDE